MTLCYHQPTLWPSTTMYSVIKALVARQLANCLLVSEQKLLASSLVMDGHLLILIEVYYHSE